MKVFEALIRRIQPSAGRKARLQSGGLVEHPDLGSEKG